MHPTAIAKQEISELMWLSMSPKLCFQILRDATASSPRSGVLSLGETKLNTPSFVSATSRGVLPHVTLDLLKQTPAPNARMVDIGQM